MLPEFIEKKSIRLGLDLQGGSQLLLQIETDEALKEKLQNLAEDIRIKLEENKILSNDISIANKKVKITLNVEDDIEVILESLLDNLGDR